MSHRCQPTYLLDDNDLRWSAPNRGAPDAGDPPGHSFKSVPGRKQASSQWVAVRPSLLLWPSEVPEKDIQGMNQESNVYGTGGWEYRSNHEHANHPCSRRYVERMCVWRHEVLAELYNRRRGGGTNIWYWLAGASGPHQIRAVLRG